MDPTHFTPTVKKDDKTLTWGTAISFLLCRKKKKGNFYVNNTLISYLVGNFYVNNALTGHAGRMIEGLKHDHILIG